MEAADAVLKFLRSVGPRTEAEFYLQLFRQTPRESFAALLVDDEALSEGADAVAHDLRFLSQLDLTPIVLLGGEGDADATQLASLLAAQAVDTAGPFSTHDIEPIASAARVGTIPLVLVGDHAQAGHLDSLGALLTALHTHKLIFLSQQGGLRLQGERLSLVDLGAEASALLMRPEFSERERRLLSAAQDLVLNRVQHRLLVAITSPLNLLHELFTVRGAGTLLRRAATIVRHVGLPADEVPAVREILRASFEREPDPRVFERTYGHCYVDAAERGAALVIDSPYGGYLSKFAVTREAQGEGLGRDLWAAIAADYRRLLWRARPGNPIAGWYQQQCQSLYRTPEWTFYTRGIPAAELSDAIAYAQAQPVDFAAKVEAHGPMGI